MDAQTIVNPLHALDRWYKDVVKRESSFLGGGTLQTRALPNLQSGCFGVPREFHIVFVFPFGWDPNGESRWFGVSNVTRCRAETIEFPERDLLDVFR